tara:strand:+ start:536 stop:730 length:195 start_codon:yes stop_codon:yes gene_type:complete
MDTNHFICKVKDKINGFNEIASIYCDVRTPKQAEKYFRKHPAIKKFIGRDQYQIIFRQEPIIIQ